MPKIQLEVCIDDPQSVNILNTCDVQRIEVCGHLSIGGVTPPLPLVRYVNEYSTIPFRVMIRVRAGLFDYTETEWKMMYEEARAIKEVCELNPLWEGFVIGALKPNGSEIDVDALKKFAQELCLSESGRHLTLHRCVDILPQSNMKTEIQRCLQAIPVIDAVLTSGGSSDGAHQGVHTLSSMMDLPIMVGSGVNEKTLPLLRAQLPQVAWWHGSFSRVVEADNRFHFGERSRVDAAKIATSRN
ncbi:CutC family protein [Gregarina niphandrodes]|uniref:Copper homeostasis protein cutC homolog n=1 Tax=Gregarina niphandrodes TaxID=110365 RepID=A0A023B8V4_GRENI|nr:CutC family protein [Gregarina niphandrodes]EZG70159.1 CutC family protein [Gregarina niphandrodes]|eukprot:XP_011129978.1 CutC family protein [Gregarina niphandrodes]